MKALISLALALVLTACASGPQLAPPTAMKAPAPIVGNTGKYMSPYTEDGTVAQWVEKGRAASAGANVGGFVGAQAGAKLMENIPFVGGMLGQKVGESVGRSVALNMVGGEAFVKETSDLSFNTVQELAVYMYVKNSSHKDYAQVLDLTQKIYPELQQAYYPALMQASARR
ncbi:hypothetical protein BURC_04212 [Burkholderiaceae bacterium]|nr:hypothetical protein BURC_04212 [Burkholderiaceae bacterium]